MALQLGDSGTTIGGSTVLDLLDLSDSGQSRCESIDEIPYLHKVLSY